MNDYDPYESLADDCVEIGTIIREDDTVVVLDIVGPDAWVHFDELKATAAGIGSGNCQISSETIDDSGQTVIHAMFDFDCAAEKLIFQMHNNQ